MNASSRRDFLKKTAYVAPLILTMNVSLAAAQVGSARRDSNEEIVLSPPLAEAQVSSLQSDHRVRRGRRGHRGFRGNGRHHRHDD